MEQAAMPINVHWDDTETKTVVRYEFLGKWTWSEYHIAINQAYEMVKDIPYTVNMILDFSKGDLLPANALSHFKSSMSHPPREFDYALVVTRSRFLESMVSIFRRLSPAGSKLILVPTLDAAHKFYTDYEKKRASNVQS
jgi:hypothetical protein